MLFIDWYRCAAISKPLENNPLVRFTVGGTEGHFDHWWAKFLRHERSVFAEVQALSGAGLHRFQWDAAWREVEAKGVFGFPPTIGLLKLFGLFNASANQCVSGSNRKMLYFMFGVSLICLHISLSPLPWTLWISM